MLRIPGTAIVPEARSRRDVLRVGALGLGGLTLADWHALEAAGQAKPSRAKAVIQLWMGGGPSHIDTFDPKPGAGADYCGPYNRPLTTNVPDVRIGQKLPLLAKQADKLAILRGMTHGVNAHETAAYIVQSGTMPSGELVYPSIGAVVALKKGYEAGYQGSLPPYMTVTSPLGRFSEAGFLGSRYKPFATGGDPSADPFTVEGIIASREMTAERLFERRALLEQLDGLARTLEHNPEIEATNAYQEKAYGLIFGEAKKAFDLSQEKKEVRERYGRTTFGQSCLLARRLVEAGVLFVTVNWGGWDTHKQHFEKMDAMLPNLDRGFSALIDDLAQRGLLGSTIVVWCGEFGRTPKVASEPPWNGGRHHFGAAFSCVVAGGGFQGGKVVGETDGRGERVVKRPIYPWDLTASIYELLGIDPAGRLPHPHGCVAYVTPIASGAVQSGGVLREIM